MYIRFDLGISAFCYELIDASKYWEDSVERDGELSN